MIKEKKWIVYKCVALLLLALCAMLLMACANEHTHEWGEWSVESAPTCTSEGTNARRCATCDEVERESIAASGHAFSDYVSNEDATCVKVGSESSTCTTCGATDVRATTLNAERHEDGDVVAVLASDDVTYHELKYSCCGVVVGREQHSLYRYSLALAEGATSCVDGVVKTHRCTSCEYTISDTVYEHINVEGADFEVATLPVERIMLGAYLTSVGVRYAEEPYIEIVAECLCAAHAGHVNLMCGAPEVGDALFDAELSPFSASVTPDADALRREVITAFYSNNLPPDEGGVNVEYKLLFEERLTPSDTGTRYELRIGFGYNEQDGTVDAEQVILLREISPVA